MLSRRAVSLASQPRSSKTGCDPRLGKLDFVFFTGDLANRGARDEYAAARTEFLDKVVAAANIAPDRLFLVPGNHDVDRSRLTFLPDLLKRSSKRTGAKPWVYVAQTRVGLGCTYR
jgi:predicted MPP superfamily phosphohydrolase